tara:strand:+ start:242 stop:412 length:171 start_codon:yes stop_codon:yes gene_type:complete
MRCPFSSFYQGILKTGNLASVPATRINFFDRFSWDFSKANHLIQFYAKPIFARIKG